MAEDFDVEAMLEAPYKKENDRYASLSPGGHHHHHYAPKERVNGKRREKRSRSNSKDNGDITPEMNGKHHHRGGEGYEVEKERRDRRRSKDRDRDRKRSRSQRPDRKERKPARSRSRERKRSKSKEIKKRSKSRDKRRSRSPRERYMPAAERVERRRSRSKDRSKRSRSKDRRYNKLKENRNTVVVVPPSNYVNTNAPSRRRSPSPRPFRRGRTPPNGLRNSSPTEELAPEERDARTVFCMQLSQRIRARDLEEFFSSVGKVRDVRLITCNKTKRFKGIAYIEFKDPESVPLALGLSGQRLLGVPISVQHTQAEKNRLANLAPPVAPPKNQTGPMRLYVGSLHFDITEDMLRGIFEPFGKIDSIQLIMDPETGRSKGYGFIMFHNAEDAKKALEQLNGFELAGRPMKVGNVTERLDMNTNASLDTDEMDRTGIDLGATGRLQLMFKLAEGAGLAVPQAAANALLATAPQPAPIPQQIAPPIATQCFMLSNMFDPHTESNPSWDSEIQDDVIEECDKHGGVLHVFVDKASPQGNVYVKCPSIATAVLAVNSLHGRWFAGRMITAAYVPLVNYHSLFPDAMTALTLLHPKRSQN